MAITSLVLGAISFLISLGLDEGDLDDEDTALGAFILQEPCSRELINSSMPFWVFCGVGSSAVAFTLQIAAQKYLHPVTASLLMSLESVFAVLGGWIFLQERLSGREIAGCVVIAGAVILAQLPFTSGQKNG